VDVFLPGRVEKGRNMRYRDHRTAGSPALLKLKARRRKTRRGFIAAFLLTAILGGIYAYYQGFFSWDIIQAVKLKTLTFSVNEGEQVIPDGGTLNLATDDYVRLQKVDTTAPFEIGVKVWSDVFSPEDLQSGIKVETALIQSDWMPGGAKEIKVNYHGHPVGGIHVEIKPTSLFWIKRAAETNDIERKITFFKEAERIDSQSVLLKTQLAQLLEQANRWKDAARYYEEVVNRDPRPLWWDKLISLYKEHRDKEALRRTYELRSKALPTKENLLEAAVFAEEIQDWEQAAQYYENALNAAPEDEKVRILKRLGFCYESLGKREQSIGAYEAALQKDPKDVNLYYTLAELYRLTKNPEKYAYCLEKALELNPGDNKSRMVLIDHYEDYNQFARETKHLKYLLAENPKDVSLHKQLAKVYEKTGQKDQLLAEYESLASLEPDNAVILFNLGVLRFEQGKYEESAVIFQKLTAKNPQDEDAHYYLFEIHRKLKDRESAIKEARRLIEINPHNVDMYDFLFAELGETDQRDSLIPLLKKGLEQNPKAAQLHEYLGLIYFEKDNIKGAINQFEQAKTISPDNISILYNLAKLYEINHDIDRALEYYQRVLAMDSSYKDAKESYLRLAMKQVQEKQE
jgi:tetratricopeptide (TPR) repeat protein